MDTSYKVLCAALLALASFPLMAQSLDTNYSQTTMPTLETVGRLARLPMRFEVNQGQTDPRVKFLVHGPAHTLFLTPDEAVLRLGQSTSSLKATKAASVAHTGISAQLPDTIHLSLAGARTPARVEGLDELQTKSNYFIGNDPHKWQTNVANYARVRYSQVYPGVDLIYYGNQERLEYDFQIAPGADPRAIAMEFKGVRRLSLDGEGNLLLHAPNNKLVLHRPVTYQEINGIRQNVPASYVLSHGRVGFNVGAYDRSQPLIIDPVLDYATFLAASFFDVALGIAVDSAGEAVVTGMTVAANFPTLNPPQPAYAGGNDAFITKLNASGTGVIYSTFVGGTGTEFGNAIALDPAGNAYITGQTSSTDFPLANALQTACVNCPSTIHAFVVKLNPAGNAFVYSTYLGGGTGEVGEAIAADSSGNAYVAGDTFSVDFPVTLGAFRMTCAGGQNRPCTDGFVSKLSANGSALAYSTYLGGTLDDHIAAIALDSSGNAYLTGTTTSNNFPTTPGSFISTCDIATLCNAAFNNAFVTKLNPTGTALVYSTYLGGSFASDGGTGIAVDPAGNAYVAGFTGAFDFPTTPGVVQSHCMLTSEGLCSGNAFITKLNPSGSGLVYSTYLGGFDGAGATGIAVDSAGDAYVIGVSTARDFPVLDPMQSCSSITSGFLTKLDPTAQHLMFSTCAGGIIGLTNFSGIALDSAGNAYIAASTQQRFPTTSGAIQTVGPGALVLKIGTATAAAAVFSDPRPSFNSQTLLTTSPPLDITLFNMGSAPLAISNIATGGDFGQTNNCGASVPAASSCIVHATFTPTAVGPRTGTITITDNAADSPQTLALSGIAINPIAQLSSTNVTFPSQAIGTNAFQSVTLTNVGVGPLAPLNVLRGSSDFFTSDDCLQFVAQSGTCTITIRFNPSAGGERTGVITLDDNAADTPQKIFVSGSSTGPGFILSATDLTFASQPQGTTSAAQSITLTNNGTAALAISSIQALFPFSQNNTCGTGLNVGANCTINVTFTPPAVGNFFGTVTISDNLAASPHTITMNGSSPGVPAATVSPSSLSFGTLLIGDTSQVQLALLHNPGTAPLLVSNVAVVGVDFTEFNDCTASGQPAGSSCIINVKFTPTMAGNEITRIDITDNAPGSPHSITLTGTGTEFFLKPAVAGQQLAQTVNAGQTASYSLLLQPAFTTRDSVTLSCTGTVPAGTCSVSPSFLTFTNPNVVPVTVSISTTARSGAGLGVPAGKPAAPTPLIALALVLAGLAAFMSATGQSRRLRKPAVLVPVLTALLLALTFVGCGGGGGATPLPPPPPGVTGTPVGSYTFTVTAKSASSTNPDQTQSLLLNVR